MSTQLMVIVANYLFIYACGMRHVAGGMRLLPTQFCRLIMCLFISTGNTQAHTHNII